MKNKSITINKYNIIGEKIRIDLDKIKNNLEVEDILIKNLNIDNEFINIMSSARNLKKAWFVNCTFSCNIPIENIECLKLENCKNVENSIFNTNIKQLYIYDCGQININDIQNLNLTSLGLSREEVINIENIEKFKNIKNLYLQELNLNNLIDYNKLEKLETVNFNGSKVDNKEVFLKRFKNRNIEISFLDENLDIG